VYARAVRPSRAASAATLALLVAPAIAACGGSGGSQVSASSYVSHVCSSVGTWLHGIQSSSTQMEQQMKSGATPASAKRALEGLASSSVADSERVVASLRGAGVPNVGNGQQIANTIVSTFERATNQLRSLQSQVSRLPNQPQAFRAAASRLGSSLQSSLSGIGSGLQGLHSPALEQAAAKSPACQSLGSSGG
jgi:hypothetical protein